MLALLAALPAAAYADPTARGYEPNPNHLSVVVTTDLVYVTWTDPTDVQPANVFAYRGDGSACPTGASDGTLIGSTSVTNHMIDGTVAAGRSYCYTVLVADASGTLHKVGSTGAVPVPDLKAPPPAAAPSSAPVPQPAAASADGLGTTQKKAIAGSAGGLLALALVVVIVRLLRRPRPAQTRPVWGSELRMSFTGLSVSALIIPAVIALAWVLVVTALLVFR
ncbi:MAG TPA: hypothetical protein VFI18_13265 [Gaiellales bacterium]|nr:hypothetical protein [Gaiellales bacterium]